MKLFPEDSKKRFEATFVVAVVLCAYFIGSAAPFKLAFLNLYAIPIVMAAYYLDLRRTMLGAAACVLITFASIRERPSAFVTAASRVELYASVATWGCLLMLTAILVDRMKSVLREEMERGRALDRKVAELKELEAVKDRFIRSVTHDLKAPLNAIQAYAQLLQTGPGLGESQRRQLGIVCRSSEDLTRFIDEVLDLSKIGAGRMTYDRARFGIEEAIQPVCDLQSGNAERFGVALTWTAAPGLPPVEADRVQIERVITNLVFNAFKFTPSGGSVAVSASAQDGGVRVAVRDSGVGIPREKLGAIFANFGQIEETRRKARLTGSGLGLGIAKEIVEGHGGRIWADSDGRSGSEISFFLPAARGAEKS